MALQIQMNSREKYAVGVGTIVVASIIIFQFIITPFIESRKSKQQQVIQLRSQLLEMKSLKTEYEQLTFKNNAAIKSSGSRDNDFTLFSFLEKLAGTTKVKENISYMKPSTSTNNETKAQLSLVAMKLHSIVMEQLVDFLYGIETSPNMIFVRGVSISKTGKDAKLLSVVLQLETVNR